uniref:S-layer homology domain-containing protein n=1 Tax=uncultured Flavonifractor sp. TaxID=1193534 RepID=UPI00262B3D9E
YGDGTFGPNDPITREQMAVMLYRYVQNGGGGFTGRWAFPLDYADADQVSDWAYEALCWMTMYGIIQGTGDGSTLSPGAGASRVEAAVMLQRFLTGGRCCPADAQPLTRRPGGP